MFLHNSVIGPQFGSSFTFSHAEGCSPHDFSHKGKMPFLKMIQFATCFSYTIYEYIKNGKQCSNWPKLSYSYKILSKCRMAYSESFSLNCFCMITAAFIGMCSSHKIFAVWELHKLFILNDLCLFHLLQPFWLFHYGLPYYKITEWSCCLHISDIL